MKKTIINITTTLIITCFGFTAFAQQASAKPKTDEPGKTTLVPAAPAGMHAAANIKTETAEQPKPVIAGGEFKPNTDKPVLREPTQYPNEIYKPVIPAVNNTPAKRPGVIEQNATAAQQKAKPVPQVHKEQ